MARTILFLAALAVLALLAVWLADNPGTVALHWHNYQVDTSVGVLIAAVAVFAFVVALAYRAWLFVRHAPAQMRHAMHERRRRRGYKALSAGMVAVAAGDAEEARRQSRRAEVLADDPPLTMLLQEQAAQLAGDDQAASTFFTAMLERPEMAFLGLRGLLTQALRQRDRTMALDLARRAYRLQPKSEWVAGSLFDLQVGAGQWADAEATLDESARARLIDADTARRKRAVLEYMRGRDADTANDRDEAMRRVRKANDLNPVFVPAAAWLARQWNREGRRSKATKTVERAWARVPHPLLLAAFRDAHPAADPLQMVKAVQQLIAANAQHRESHLALAEAALDARLWGEAREHLGQAGGDDPPAGVCRLMARLEEEEHADLQAARAWLVQASLADPDPAWVCRSCANAVAEWVPVCSNCDAFDSHDWRTPAHVTRLAAPRPVKAIEARKPDGAETAAERQTLLAVRQAEGAEPLAKEAAG